MSYNPNHLSRESWTRVREIVRRKDRETCQYCGDHASCGEVDHILPLHHGGRDSLDNLVWACLDCNREKQGLTLRQWMKKLHRIYRENPPIIRPEHFGKGECKDWLIPFMRGNGQSVPAQEVFRQARLQGFSENVVKSAKAEINVDSQLPRIESVRMPRHWEWKLIPIDDDNAL